MSVPWTSIVRAGMAHTESLVDSLNNRAQAVLNSDNNNAQLAINEANRDAQNTLSAAYASLQNFYRSYQNQMQGKQFDMARDEQALEFAAQIDKLYSGNLAQQEKGATMVGAVNAFAGANGIGGGSLAVIAQNQELQNAMYDTEVTGNAQYMKSALLKGVDSASLKQALGTDFSTTVANINRIQSGHFTNASVDTKGVISMWLAADFAAGKSLVNDAQAGAFNQGGSGGLGGSGDSGGIMNFFSNLF